VKCSDVFHNSVSNIITRYIDHMEFTKYFAFSCTTFFDKIYVPFLSLCICLYVLNAYV
jgi:hypothetical protein